jgi:hypothetical protein
MGLKGGQELAMKKIANGSSQTATRTEPETQVFKRANAPMGFVRIGKSQPYKPRHPAA